MAPKVKVTGTYSYQNQRSSSFFNLKLVRGLIVTMLVFLSTSEIVANFIVRYGYTYAIPPLFIVRGIKIYNPFLPWRWTLRALLAWNFSPNVLKVLLMLGFIVFFTGLFIYVAITTSRGKGDLSTIQGSARWATKDDLIEARLLPYPGTTPTEISVYVGGWYDAKKKCLMYLIHGGPEHVLAFAPTRSGKGVGLVIPSLLRWADSVLVYDIKGENYQLTSGWRREELGNAVIRLDPTDPNAYSEGTSGTFNPLEELILDYGYPEGKEPTKDDDNPCPPMQRINSGETAAIQNLVNMIVDPEGKGLDDHWSKTSHSLIVGCITHLLYRGKVEGWIPSLADVANEFTKPGVSWQETIKGWQSYPHLGMRWENLSSPDPVTTVEVKMTPIVHPVVANAAQEMLNRDEREASSVLSTAVSYLTLYRDPIIAKNTSRSSFHIQDLMNQEQPVSLYLVVKPVDKDRIKPFVRLFITQVIRRLANTMQFKDGQQVKSYKHRLLLMLDEFPSLGRLPIFEEALAFIAGYGLKAYLIIQDIAQLHKIYGKDEAITGNCHVKIAYATSNIDTAKYLSESSGTTTVIKESESVSRDTASLLKRNVSTSIQEVQRPLLTVDECMRLKGPEKDSTGQILTPGDMLIFTAGYAAVYGRQILYFLDPEFSRRVRINPPDKSDRLLSQDGKKWPIRRKSFDVSKGTEEAANSWPYWISWWQMHKGELDPVMYDELLSKKFKFDDDEESDQIQEQEHSDSVEVDEANVA